MSRTVALRVVGLAPSWAITLIAASVLQTQHVAAATPARLPTVIDSITLTTFETPIQFSPDGRRAAFLTRRGVLETDSNRYTLWCVESADDFAAARAKQVLTVEATGNRPGIDRLTWSGSERVLFLRNDPAGGRQLFAVDVTTDQLTQLTRHATDVVAYKADSSSSTLEFTAVAASGTRSNVQRTSRWLEPVDGDQPTDLLVGYGKGGPATGSDEVELFASVRNAEERRLDIDRYEGPRWWQDRRAAPAASSGRDAQRVVDIRQDMNTPPRLVAINPKSRKQRVLYDPNPQLAALQLSTCEEITWLSSGETVRAGLYLPPGHRRGVRHPFVIQTHGWDRTQFRMDGDSTAGYAAQALAARGIVVAQVPIAHWQDLGTPREGEKQSAMFESLIEYLDRERGIIDPQAIGILGWSRTGYHVRYALTFSNVQYAAAILSDGMDVSYGQYLAWPPQSEMSKLFEDVLGGSPFGGALPGWVRGATGFNLNRINTPTLILGFRTYSLLNNWEWFTGLRHLGKPVEFVWMPDALHAPVKPSERLAVAQGAVDWFLFWLRGEEDKDATKADQYVRWRQLREVPPPLH